MNAIVQANHEEGAVSIEAVQPIDPMLAMIERALQNDVEMDKLERLMDMQERAQDRQAKAAFNEAVALAKGEIGPIVKDHTVDFTKGDQRVFYMHEGFDTIAKAVDPIFSKYGLSYRFRTNQEYGEAGGRITVTCIVSKGGYSEETSLSASPDTSGAKGNAQAIGSTITYLQRYTLKAALGLAAALDNDALGDLSDSKFVSIEQVEELRRLAKEGGVDDSAILKWAKIDKLENLRMAKYGEAEARLKQRIAQAKKKAGQAA